MNLLTTTFKFLNLLGGFSVVGALLAMAFLLINKEGFLTTSGEKLRGFLRFSALIWVIGAFGTIIFTLAQILGTTATFANSLVSTSPISGSTLSVSPTSVTVTGQLPLLADANEISVTDPNGVRVDDGTIMVNDVSATVGLRPLTESGFYTVSYILFAEADAPLEGSYRFKYQAPSTIAPENPTPQPSESHTPASSSWGTNVFVILLLVLAVGVTIGLSLYARKLFNNR